LGKDLEPTVPLILHGPSTPRIAAVLDTGFSDYVCLSRANQKSMNLQPVGRMPYELADGSLVDEDVFLGEVTFDGQRQRVLVTLTDSTDSLIGTALLKDCSLRIDFVRRIVEVRRAKRRG
jgi:clan AA aspartic protease